MKNLIKIAQIFLLLIFLSSCKNTSNDELFIEDSEDQKSEKLIRAKNRIEVRYSCGEDGISEFINNGWVIVEEYTEEKICTWKSFPATKDCDMEKDKGCKVTIPDEIGKEKVYVLEKQSKKMPKKEQNLIELIFKRLKNNNFRKINLEKEELTEFINYLIKNN